MTKEHNLVVFSNLFVLSIDVVKYFYKKKSTKYNIQIKF